MKNYLTFLAMLTLVGCTTTKPVVTPIKVSIVKLNANNESVYQANEENKTSISKITILSTKGNLSQDDILALIDKLKSLPTTK